MRFRVKTERDLINNLSTQNTKIWLGKTHLFNLTKSVNIPIELINANPINNSRAGTNRSVAI